MDIINRIDEIRARIKIWKKEGLRIGLVPTMGFLHEGHMSLIEKAVIENDRVVVSIFVNPTQFGQNEDFDSYPRNLNNDVKLCMCAGVAVIFHPEPSDMYSNGYSTYVDMNTLTKGLCGKTRPTHFRGVCTVVAKLFNIVTPDKAYFGQKDAQQLAVIRQMVRDLNYDIEIVSCSIVREKDGLAKSSRNIYLSEVERAAATIIHKALKYGEYAMGLGITNVGLVKKIITDTIMNEPLAKIDYVEIVDINNLEPVEKITSSVLSVVAVYIGKTRLIDNFIYHK